MTLSGLDIVVIGAGIGGLTAALALRRIGATIRVLEQTPALTEVGAGLQISPNGLRVIEALGLGNRLAARAVRGHAVSLRNGVSGTEVARLDLTRLPPDQRYVFAHRADLIDMLAQATQTQAQGMTLCLDHSVARVEAGAQPRVLLADGRVITADLVIGADGIHSRLREALNGTEQPVFTGQVAWRCLVPNSPLHQPDEARVHMGAGRHMVTYPVRGGEMLNVVAVEERSTWATESWSHRDDPANLRAAFAEFGAEVQQILALAEKPGLWGLFRHPVAARWHGQGLAILGDAAHPTLPFLAQGANMALEDAWCLAAALSQAADLESGLAAYQALRKPRVARVIAAASKNARNYHLAPGPARFAAHIALGVLSRLAPGQMLARFNWLYGYDVTAAAGPLRV